MKKNQKRNFIDNISIMKCEFDISTDGVDQGFFIIIVSKGCRCFTLCVNIKNSVKKLGQNIDNNLILKALKIGKKNI